VVLPSIWQALHPDAKRHIRDGMVLPSGVVQAEEAALQNTVVGLIYEVLPPENFIEGTGVPIAETLAACALTQQDFSKFMNFIQPLCTMIGVDDAIQKAKVLLESRQRVFDRMKTIVETLMTRFTNQQGHQIANIQIAAVNVNPELEAKIHEALLQIRELEALYTIGPETADSALQTGFLEGSGPGIPSPYTTVNFRIADVGLALKAIIRRIKALNHTLVEVSDHESWISGPLGPIPSAVAGTDEGTASGVVRVPVLARQALGEVFVQEGVAGSAAHPGLVKVAEGQLPYQVHSELQSKMWSRIYETGHGKHVIKKVIETEENSSCGRFANSTEGETPLESGPMHDHGEEFVMPNWAAASTEQDSILTLSTPITTNLFVNVVSPSSVQSRGETQENLAILKSVPVMLVQQKALFGVMRGIEAAGEAGHPPSRIVFFVA
jgi:hypothetical protein